VKTTIEIPEQLYKQAKIRAIERGTTLKEIVLSALRRDLNDSAQESAEDPTRIPYWANPKLLPEYEALVKSGGLRGGTDSTIAISEERDAR
jgi:hypothetical protein